MFGQKTLPAQISSESPGTWLSEKVQRSSETSGVAIGFRLGFQRLFLWWPSTSLGRNFWCGRGQFWGFWSAGPWLQKPGSAKFSPISHDVSHLTPSYPKSNGVFEISGSQTIFFAIGSIDLSDLPLGMARTPLKPWKSLIFTHLYLDLSIWSRPGIVVQKC